jgi:lipopolysaccharide export system protein LptA
MLYNTNSHIAYLDTTSTIYSKDGTIYTKNGTYNTDTQAADLYDRSLVVAKNGNTLQGDTLYYDQQNGIGEAFGNIELVDTAKKVTLYGDIGYYFENVDSARVYGHALAKEYSQKDTLYLHGDTILTYRRILLPPSPEPPAEEAAPAAEEAAPAEAASAEAGPNEANETNESNEANGPNESNEEAPAALLEGPEPAPAEVSEAPAEAPEAPVEKPAEGPLEGPEGLAEEPVAKAPESSAEAPENPAEAPLEEPAAEAPAEESSTTVAEAGAEAKAGGTPPVALEEAPEGSPAESSQAAPAEKPAEEAPLAPEKAAPLALEPAAPADTVHYIVAAPRAKFYRVDLQGLCDSMTFVSKDSLLYLDRHPVVWNENKQIFGNEIIVHLNDSTVDWAKLPNFGFVAEHIDDEFYNQLTGKEMFATFVDGKLHHLDVSGNVQAIMLPQENDSTYNKIANLESSYMAADFLDQQLQRMKLWPETSGTMTPLYLAKKQLYYLPQFRWFEPLRPLKPEDVFEFPQELIDLFNEPPFGSSRR